MALASASFLTTLTALGGSYPTIRVVIYFIIFSNHPSLIPLDDGRRDIIYDHHVVKYPLYSS